MKDTRLRDHGSKEKQPRGFMASLDRISTGPCRKLPQPSILVSVSVEALGHMEAQGKGNLENRLLTVSVETDTQSACLRR